MRRRKASGPVSGRGCVPDSRPPPEEARRRLPAAGAAGGRGLAPKGPGAVRDSGESKSGVQQGKAADHRSLSCRLRACSRPRCPWAGGAAAATREGESSPGPLGMPRRTAYRLSQQGCCAFRREENRSSRIGFELYASCAELNKFLPVCIPTAPDQDLVVASSMSSGYAAAAVLWAIISVRVNRLAGQRCRLRQRACFARRDDPPCRMLRCPPV